MVKHKRILVIALAAGLGIAASGAVSTHRPPRRPASAS